MSSLRTAFSTTLWGVGGAFGVLFLATLCSAARETQISFLATEALYENGHLKKAQAQHTKALTEAGDKFCQSAKDMHANAQHMRKTVGAFQVAANSIAAHQQLYETSLNGLKSTLDGIAGQIEQSLTPGARKLTDAAGEVQEAATALKKSSAASEVSLKKAATDLNGATSAFQSASQVVVEQQSESLNAYREELAQVFTATSTSLTAVEAVVRSLPAEISASTRPALDEWAQGQLQEQTQIVESLRELLHSMQIFLYYADQSTHRRDEQLGQRHDTEMKALRALAQGTTQANEARASANTQLEQLVGSARTLGQGLAQIKDQTKGLSDLQTLPQIKEQLRGLELLRALPEIRQQLSKLEELQAAVPLIQERLEELVELGRTEGTASRQAKPRLFSRTAADGRSTTPDEAQL